ncbi:hypothetical protein FNV43_RR10405 [Rhamnella rubrinervis]|uniref:Uncharacterized protein n=1 Tax=Rhamnella rubrinervis TaxID=2594499 RepID=A0A8K0MKR0_9ROSA|nr:hypothetical protein FNV43_RR10405 [Rhamnella rubrinervis]
MALNIGRNFLTGFNQQSIVFPWVNLLLFEVSYKMLQGPLPIPPPSLQQFDVSNNNLNEEVAHLFCNMSSLYAFKLSNSNLNGMVPHYLGNSSTSLSVLSLGKNSFHGAIPEICSNGGSASSLGLIDLRHNIVEHFSDEEVRYLVFDVYEMTVTSKGVDTYYQVIQDIFAFVDLSDNKFEGEISDLFGKLKALRSLNLSNNLLTGGIPSSLGNLTYLESLDLSRNKLTGEYNLGLSRANQVKDLNDCLARLNRMFFGDKVFELAQLVRDGGVSPINKGLAAVQRSSRAGKNAEREEGDADRSSWSNKRSRGENGAHSRRNSREYESGGESYSRIERLTERKGGGHRPVENRNKDNRPTQRIWLCKKEEPTTVAASADPDDCSWYKEQRNEPLRNYIQRFNDMKVEIMDCPDVVACNAFKRGLLPGTKIYDYMVQKPRNPANLAKA